MNINLNIRGLALLAALCLVVAGCSNPPVSSKKAPATLTIAEDSAYTTTFQDLRLGRLLDYRLELSQADESWVRLWVEMYEDGQLDSPETLIELSYGMHPEPVHDGPLGWAVVYPGTDAAAMSLYTGDTSGSQDAEATLFTGSEGTYTAWDYAWKQGERLAIDFGETRVLGAYRIGAGNELRTYNLQDESEVEKMIAGEKRVFLLKFNLERIETPDESDA